MNRFKKWLKQYLRKLLDMDALELEVSTLKAKVEMVDIVKLVTESHPAPEPKQPKIPFRLHQDPFRKRRAAQEQKLSPEYMLQQQRKRDEKAKQPVGGSSHVKPVR